MVKIRSSEITPEHIFFSRRQFLKAGALAATALALGACGPRATSGGEAETTIAAAGETTDELGDALTPYEVVTNYNNYYEFTVDKERVAPLAKDFPTSPWTVQVGGLVNNPKTYGVEDLLTKFTQEERIYRHRCV